MKHDLPHMSDDELRCADELIEVALEEDLADGSDVTTELLIPPEAVGGVQIVSRRAGVLCGMEIAEMVFQLLDPAIKCRHLLADGEPLEPGSVIATLQGPMASLLTGERTALNFLTLLSGTASLTRRYVDAVSGHKAKILDTRKTLPGLRLLQKYAVRCGGGCPHRRGLFDAVLAKDNHLAWLRANRRDSLASIVREVREMAPAGMLIEFEVDSLQQLQEILPARPDVVLLDNMPPDDLRQAVRLRDTIDSTIQLEASGGVTLEMVAQIAATGVDRISVGALTHSAPALDIGFDWQTEKSGSP